MNFLRKFMAGRYGSDQLSLALLIVSFLLTLIMELIRVPYLVFIGLIPLAISFYRIMSKNIQKRSMENYKFAMLMSPVYVKYRRVLGHVVRLKDKSHKYYKCPECKSSLRLPKGKGIIVITCPKCRAEFKKKT